jgi:hypothetical protein
MNNLKQILLVFNKVECDLNPYLNTFTECFKEKHELD